MRGNRATRSILAVGLCVIFALIYGWNVIVWAPQGRRASQAREGLRAAETTEQTLRAELAELRRLAADSESQEDDLARLKRLIPAEPDLAGFIRTMNDVAARSQVEWSSLTPAAPTAGAGGTPATIGLTIRVEGSFYQLLDYLQRIENLDRLVVIDAVDMTTAPTTGGSPKLALNLRARIFSSSPGGQATPASPPAPAAPTPGNGPSVPVGGS